MIRKFAVIFTVLSLISLQCNAVNVYCYYASWAAYRPENAKVASENLDPHLCTHYFYSFLSLESNGSLSYLDENLDVKLNNIMNLTNLKNINPDLKLLFSVGGASAPAYIFADIAGNDEKLKIFVESCQDFLKKYNFDGIDIDWEYPFDKSLLIKMAEALRKVLEPNGQLVTTAVAYNPEDAGYDVPEMNRVFDLINVMSYDFHGANAGKLGQNAPLYYLEKESGWQKSVLNCNASLWNWRNKGASPDKLSLGAGFYGHSFLMADPSKHFPEDPSKGPGEKGPYTDNVGTLGYLELCELHKNGEIIWEDQQKVPYMIDGDLWVGFDNEKSLREKIKYIKSEGISGIMIWSIETDDTKGVCGGDKWPLLKAINDEIKN